MIMIFKNKNGDNDAKFYRTAKKEDTSLLLFNSQRICFMNSLTDSYTNNSRINGFLMGWKVIQSYFGFQQKHQFPLSFWEFRVEDE